MMEPTNPDEKETKNVENDKNPIEDDRSRTSSFSSASSATATSELSFEDPYQIERNEHGSFALDQDLSEQELQQPGESGSDTDDALREGAASALESPPSQVMERPPNTSGYRIPSYVFSRNKSNTPNPEWSTASNESLFSIHTGNMSFTRDQFSWLLKSGELGMYGPGDIRKSGELGYYGELGKVSDLRKSGELPPASPKIVHKAEEPKTVDTCESGESSLEKGPDVHKSGEEIIAEHFKTSSSSPQAANKVSDGGETLPHASDVALDLAVGSKKEDSKIKGTRVSVEEMRLSASVSHHSDASGQSFAFPVLEEIDREKSVNSGRSRVDQAKEPTATADEQEQPKTPTSAPEGAATSTSSSWFSCFSCCFCC